RPFCTSPYRVHCDTTRSAPPPGTSARPRFIFPAASPNTRRLRILSAIHASASSVSVGANPASTRRPGPMLPETLPSIRTAARETRWRTTLTGRSLYCHALRQISRLVNVTAPSHRDVIRQQLQRQDGEHRRQQIEGFGDFDLVVRGARHARIPFRHHGEHPPAPRPNRFCIQDDLLINAVLRGDEDDRHEVVDQGDRAVFHL